MYYTSIGLLAALVLIITNWDVLLKPSSGKKIPAQAEYRKFLFCVLTYYMTDMLWGILDGRNMVPIQFLDTEVYFVAMALTVFFWTRYAIKYLERKNLFSIILLYSGRIFLIFEAIVIILNFFQPIMFYYDEAGHYHEEFCRNVTLILQILLFLLTAGHSFYMVGRSKDSTKRRHRTVGLFGLAIAGLIVFQYFFPLLPLYSVGFMLGGCFLRTFVIDDEKEEYRRELEHSLKREQNARKLAYTDALTGVRSKLAFAEVEDHLEQGISDGTVDKIATAVFDLNYLKKINDTKGHDVGDQYIKDACRIIREHFSHSPLFRIGGDEFCTILAGKDYVDRFEIMAKFNKIMDENNKNGSVVVSVGMAEYIPGTDNSFKRVFERADQMMYARKDELKKAI